MARFGVGPGQFPEAAEWVLMQYEAREAQRVNPRAISAMIQNSAEVPRYDPPLRRLSKLRMGASAFMEARARHKELSLWAVDYCDGIGARVRIGPLVAEPSLDLGEWEIEVT